MLYTSIYPAVTSLVLSRSATAFWQLRSKRIGGLAVKSLIIPQDKDEVLHRLRRVRRDSQGQWGRMNSHQMICHLSDAFRVALGAKAANLRGNAVQRIALKWVAIKLPLRWPKGFETMPEVNQELSQSLLVHEPQALDD